MMYLCSRPTPSFRSCDRKRFRPTEYHVTRTYRKSVLILMLGGVLRFREDGKDIELSAGEYYIQREGLLQEGIVLGESPEYYYMEFEGAEYSADATDGVPLRGRYPAELVLPVVEECVDAYYGKTASRFFLNALLYRVFDALSTNCGEALQSTRLAHRLKVYIEANYPSPLTLEALAARFGYSPNHVSRVFRAAYSLTPHRYLASVRIAKAHWLLTNTDAPVNRIAEMVGYTDASAFYRGFVRTYGLSPRAVRNGTEE